MTAQQNNKRASVWTRWLPPVVSSFPVLTAAEQTRLSWARRIDSLDDLPPAYVAGVQPSVERTGHFPYAVLTPSYAQFISRTTEKLVLCLDDEVRVLERSATRVDGSELRITAFYYADLSAVEIGCVLLKSWIRLLGRTTAGPCTAITIRFNTVGDYLFFPLLNRIRGVAAADQALADPALLEHERACFNYLAHDHFKFMNAAKKSLLPGEHVLDSLMQPEIRTPLVTLFGHAYLRSLAPAHIVVLTDRELIVIAEEHLGFWGGETRYGSIRTCAPLHKVCDATLAAERNLLRLTVELEHEQSLALDFLPEQRPALEQLIARLRAARTETLSVG